MNGSTNKPSLAAGDWFQVMRRTTRHLRPELQSNRRPYQFTGNLFASGETRADQAYITRMGLLRIRSATQHMGSPACRRELLLAAKIGHCSASRCARLQ
jgi:hypothetical protein